MWLFIFVNEINKLNNLICPFSGSCYIKLSSCNSINYVIVCVCLWKAFIVKGKDRNNKTGGRGLCGTLFDITQSQE